MAVGKIYQMSHSLVVIGSVYSILRIQRHLLSGRTWCVNSLLCWRLESDIDVEEISQDTKDGTVCRVCRSCSSAMVRLNQLDSRVRLNINNAITAICNVRGMPAPEAEPDQQGPSRAEPDQERPSRKRSHSESLNETTRTRNSHSPDVSVSHI